MADKDTPKAASRSADVSADQRSTPEEEGLSRQAQFSTYTQVPPDTEQVPPPGPTVEQELGAPDEDASPKAFKYGG